MFCLVFLFSFFKADGGLVSAMYNSQQSSVYTPYISLFVLGYQNLWLDEFLA